MKRFSFLSIVALTLFLAIAAASQQPPFSRGPSWAFPSGETPQSLHKEGPGLLNVPGSSKAYTQQQIDDGSNPPDWFPDEHPLMPEVVAHGNGKGARACANCHLTTGMGH